MLLMDIRVELNELLQASGIRWPCPVRLKLGPAREFPEARNMAYTVDGTQEDPAFLEVVVAPRFLRQRRAVVRGVLMHELGHAMAFCTGDSTHPERVADELAEAAFGVPIRYDARDVQTTGPGQRPRPAYLPT